MSPIVHRHRLSLLVLTIALSLPACMGSNAPLLDADSRVLPFLPPATFEVYERGSSSEPWTKQKDKQTFTAGSDLVVSSDGMPDDKITFHPLSPQRFVVQYEAAKPSRIRYRYAVLEVRNGEGIFHMTLCQTLDEKAFKAAGGSLLPDQHDPICNLDTASDPRAVLRTFAANPVGYQVRYVPVR